MGDFFRTARIAWAALLVAVSGAPVAAAEPANPHLTALVRGVDDEDNRRDTLRIEKLDIDVRIHGGIADTVVTARIANSSDESLEADFGLALPLGSTVTGYALDVGGVLVEGVLVDQRKARQAYQDRVREEVDPGLGEVLRGYQFRTKVSPVAPGGRRTIRIRFATPLDPRLGYVLPLAGSSEIGELGIAIEASGLAREPAVGLPNGGRARAERRAGAYRFTYAGTQERLRDRLTVSGIERAAPLLAATRPNGDTYVELSDKGAAQSATGRPSSVAVLWDRSLSRADDALAAEAALLKAYLERTRPDRIELIFFDGSLVERVAAATPEAAAAAVAGTVYRGASSFAVLSPHPIEAEACLLFSDGLVTIDRRDAFRPACPVFAVSSAPDADRAWLAALAKASGGMALQLDSGNSEDVLGRLTGAAPRVLAVRTAAGVPIDFTLLDAPENGWRLIAPMPSSASIVVRLAGPEGRAVDRVYAADGSEGEAPRLDGAGALWAADRLALLAASDDSDHEAIVAFARRHRVAGPDISFIVLETPEDYARAGIEPPLAFAAAKRAVYDRVLAEKLAGERAAQGKRLKTVLAAWEKQKAWWNQRFDPRARPVRTQDQESGNERPSLIVEVPPAPAPMEPAAPAAAEPAAAEEALMGLPGVEADDGTGSIVLTATRRRRPTGLGPLTASGNEAGATGATIETAPWSPDRPYLKALAAAPPAELEAAFAREQAGHGALPAFWLDVSDWYFRQGRRPEALRLLLSALDLPTRDSETVAIVAERLVRWGELDRAIHLYERLAAAEPDRPQPLRSLALALAKRAEGGSGEQARADLARSIALLTQTIVTQWSEEFDGIELISLMEVNRLIPRYRRLGGRQVPLDSRLIALLDVDLRVVIEWNTEKTDLDLWVDEPNGERSIYNNPLTLIGGHLSNDMTSGYGPEEYLLRRAPAGTYTVSANVYASDRLNPNGASRITARLIHDFGRSGEREQLVDIELLPGESDGQRLIGRIRVDP
jgi:tetratricopeptide (TPR) repeat protein